MIDLVLGDDHTLFVDALATVLTQSGFTVGAIETTAAATMRSVQRLQPDVCLLDRHFSDGDALDIIGDLIAASARTKVLMLSADNDEDGIQRALCAGAAGYLHKGRSLTALTSTIRRIMRDEVVVDLPIRPPVRRPAPDADAHRLARYLTARERECLAMLVEGLSTRAMVNRLGVSSTTVRTHVQALLTKLGVHSRLEAASFAVRHRLIDDPSMPTSSAQVM